MIANEMMLLVVFSGESKGGHIIILSSLCYSVDRMDECFRSIT
jgi:hypothetical protein